MKIVIVHAYSTTNSGDGLLVEEARELVLSAFDSPQITLLALDPGSFDGRSYHSVLHAVTGESLEPRPVSVLGRGLASLAAGVRSKAVRSAIDDADLVVAVGGGYLRAKNPLEAVKTVAAHGSQLPRRDHPPTVYLPQSIGPLRYGTYGLLRRRLRRVTHLYVRDDRSRDLLHSISSVRRSPDMALLGLPHAWNPTAIVANGGHVGLVARHLPGDKQRINEYHARVKELVGTLPDVELLVQANARGNNDVQFYRDVIGHGGALRTLREATSVSASTRPSVVVSVRLHGAIESVRSGVPSVHLSYERKGWGAFDDLGLPEYVHNSFNFDPHVVSEQAAELRNNSVRYWERIGDAAISLRATRDHLVESLRDAVGPTT